MKVCALLLAWLFAASALAAESVRVGLLHADGAQRAAFNARMRTFERRHPGLTVTVRAEAQEQYKASLPKWLAAKEGPADVLYWFAGGKLKGLVERGWVEPIDDLWRQHGFERAYTKAAKAAVRVDGSVYGLPLSYYQWGFYYRKSVFRKLGLRPPRTWTEFCAAGEKMKAAGIVPVALGAKDGWPAAGWFDYLNLRLNGFAFHQSLMAGRVPYTDARVREVFKYWGELAERGFFLPDYDRLDWQGAMPYLYRERAGMLLMGNFLVPTLPAALRDDIGFFPFPTIKAGVAAAEDAPMDILFIPRNAPNKAGARALLAFLGQASVQSELNAALAMISPNRGARLGDDPFIRAGARLLAGADDIAQFYDRDTPPEMAGPGMAAFVKFLRKPSDIDACLTELEQARKAAFK